MLSLSKISSAAGCDYYLELAREDYYLNGGEPQGRWYGEALSHFGIKENDVVEAKTLKTLFAGYHPVTSDRKSTRLNSSHVSESRMPSSA